MGSGSNDENKKENLDDATVAMVPITSTPTTLAQKTTRAGNKSTIIDQ